MQAEFHCIRCNNVHVKKNFFKISIAFLVYFCTMSKNRLSTYTRFKKKLKMILHKADSDVLCDIKSYSLVAVAFAILRKAC